MKPTMQLVILAILTLTDNGKAGAGVGAVAQREPVRRALAWLVQATESDAWDRASPGFMEGYRDVALTMTAWLLETNADFPEFQAARARFRDRMERLAVKLKSDVGFQGNWLQGFAALYFYERSLCDQRPHPALEIIARGFIDRQNNEGGWSHGTSKAPSSYYPSTLIATTNLALLALGAAERTKRSIAQEANYQRAVREGLRLLRDVQGPHGGMPYGGRGYRVSREAGRTVAMLVALATLDQTHTDLFRRAATYVLRHVEAIPDGYDSRPMHVALGGLGCFLLSDDAWRLYDAKVLQAVRQAQHPDGSFSVGAVSGKESDNLPPLDQGDKLFMTAYTTALYAVGLSAERSNVARNLRLRMPFVLASTNPIRPEPPLPLAWQVGLDHVVALSADAGTVAALQANGTLHFFAVGSGALLGKVHLLEKVDHRDVSLKMRDGKAFVLSMPKGSTLYWPPQPEVSRGWLACCDPKKPEPVWQLKMHDPVRTWSVDDKKVSLLTFGPSGELVVLAAATGQIMHRFSVGEVAMWHSGLRALPHDCYAFAHKSHLKVYDGKGNVIWKARNKADEGVTPTAFSSLAASTGHLYCGGTDGRLTCFEQETGKILWQIGLESGIHAIYVNEVNAEQALAVGFGGMVYGLRNGKTAWSVDAGSGVSREGGVVSQLTDAGLFVEQEIGRVMLVDVAHGRIKNVLHAKHWCATNQHWITWSNGKLQAYRLQ